jgi:uncharacterized membrane protein YbhN (UPF0104 family)
MLHAFGAPPSLAVVALAYFVGQAGNTLPIPGAVSGGIVGVLIAFGVGADVALVSVLAYRSGAIWLPAGIGVATLPSLRSRLQRWQAPEPAAEPEYTPLVQLVPPAPACRVSAAEALAA